MPEVAPTVPIPTEHDDPINAQILAVSEDRVAGFVREPFRQIAAQSGVELAVVPTDHTDAGAD